MRATTENLNVSSPSLQRIHSVLGFYETVQGTTLSFLVNLEKIARPSSSTVDDLIHETNDPSHIDGWKRGKDENMLRTS